MLYSLNKIFYSIQGEGRNTGMPAWFIRFAGCNLDCSWCDTDHKEKFRWKKDDILKIIQSNSCKNVILTGGEPTIQNLYPLIVTLKQNGYYITIETNGTNSMDETTKKFSPYKNYLSWITVSPKILPIKIDFFVEEVKVIWPTQMDLKACLSIPAMYHYLQPLDEDDVDHVKETVKMVLDNPGWRLSLQVQKIVGIK